MPGGRHRHGQRHERFLTGRCDPAVDGSGAVSLRGCLKFYCQAMEMGLCFSHCCITRRQSAVLRAPYLPHRLTWLTLTNSSFVVFHFYFVCPLVPFGIRKNKHAQNRPQRKRARPVKGLLNSLGKVFQRKLHYQRSLEGGKLRESRLFTWEEFFNAPNMLRKTWSGRH